MVDGRMTATLPGSLTLKSKVQQSIKLARPGGRDMFLRFPSNLLHDGKVIGNGTLDIDDIDIDTMDILLLQILSQNAGESFYGYRPTALLMCPISGSKKQFRRIGCATLDEDSLDVFEACDREEVIYCEVSSTSCLASQKSRGRITTINQRKLILRFTHLQRNQCPFID